MMVPPSLALKLAHILNGPYVARLCGSMTVHDNGDGDECFRKERGITALR